MSRIVKPMYEGKPSVEEAFISKSHFWAENNGAMWSRNQNGNGLGDDNGISRAVAAGTLTFLATFTSAYYYSHCTSTGERII